MQSAAVRGGWQVRGLPSQAWKQPAGARRSRLSFKDTGSGPGRGLRSLSSAGAGSLLQAHQERLHARDLGPHSVPVPLAVHWLRAVTVTRSQRPSAGRRAPGRHTGSAWRRPHLPEDPRPDQSPRERTQLPRCYCRATPVGASSWPKAPFFCPHPDCTVFPFRARVGL